MFFFPLAESIPQILAGFRTGDNSLKFVCMRNSSVNIIYLTLEQWSYENNSVEAVT